MNKINFFLVIIIGIGLVCGCNYSYKLGGENSNRRAGNNSGDKQSRQVKSDRSTGDEKSNSQNDADDESDSPSKNNARRKFSGDVDDVSSLAGKWVWSRSGSSTYSDGGSYVGSNGSRFTYEFSDDGAVEFTGIMNVMQGGCSQQIFTTKSGQATLDGDQLTVEWSPVNFTRDFSCDSGNNYEKTLPAEIETSKVAFKNSSGQEQLCMTIKEEACFSPAE